MFALHIIMPASMGICERHQVLLTDKRHHRDAIVKFINKNQQEWSEFKRSNPGTLVPTYFCWYPGTTAEAISMRDARKLIAGDDPMIENVPACDRHYNYAPVDSIYEWEVHPLGEYRWKGGAHYYAA